MVRRITAMTDHRTEGKQELRSKIAKGTVPPEAVDAHCYLSEKELDIPLLAQFGISLIKIRQKIDQSGASSSDLNQKNEHVQDLIDRVNISLEELHKRIGRIVRHNK